MAPEGRLQYNQELSCHFFMPMEIWTIVRVYLLYCIRLILFAFCLTMNRTMRRLNKKKTTLLILWIQLNILITWIIRNITRYFDYQLLTCRQITYKQRCWQDDEPIQLLFPYSSIIWIMLNTCISCLRVSSKPRTERIIDPLIHVLKHAYGITTVRLELVTDVSETTA